MGSVHNESAGIPLRIAGGRWNNSLLQLQEEKTTRGENSMKKSETFDMCQGCKFNVPYNDCESVCQRQELMLKGELEVPESCENKQERVYVA